MRYVSRNFLKILYIASLTNKNSLFSKLYSIIFTFFKEKRDRNFKIYKYIYKNRFGEFIIRAFCMFRTYLSTNYANSRK